MEKTTHAMNELTSNVQQSAKNAGNAEKLAGSAQHCVQSCDDVMKNTISAMGKLQESRPFTCRVTNGTFG